MQTEGAFTRFVIVKFIRLSNNRFCKIISKEIVNRNKIVYIIMRVIWNTLREGSYTFEFVKVL